MKRKKHKTLNANKIKNKQQSKQNDDSLNDNFDWDFLFDREWSRTKK